MPKSETFIKEEVLEKALSVFRAKGYSGSSMQELVDAMGINRSSIYNSFGDKQNLFKEALLHYQKQQQSKTNDWLLAAGDAKEAIERLFWGIQEEIISDTERNGCFMAKSTSEFGKSNVDFYHILTGNQRDMEALFADLIRKGQQDGKIKSALDPEATAGYLFTSLQGLRMSGVLRPETKYLKPIVTQIIKVL